MCLPDFQEFKQIDKSSPIIGYRTWRNKIGDNPLILLSEHQEYKWNKLEGPHEVKDKNSGIYAYNNYNYNNYYNNNYYNNYNYNNYYYNNYYNYNYYNLSGIIIQYGKVAIHNKGQRSEFAKIKTLFTIRESDMRGPKEFMNWIKKFNIHIVEISKQYECDTIHWQDFNELKEKEKE